MTSKKNNNSGLLLIGGGGHALSVYEALMDNIAQGGIVYKKIAALDIPEKVGASLLDIPIVGADGDLGRLRHEFDHAFISLGGAGGGKKRERLYQLAAGHRYMIPNILHPKAHLSRSSTYGRGIFAGVGAFVNSGSEISDMCILNTGCIVEHECYVGAFTHIAPGAILCGGVHVGAGAHIGAGSVLIQNIKVGEGAIVGAGSVVVRDIPAGVVAFGNPCRVIRPVSIQEYY